MQFCDCLVLIGGDIGNSIQKERVSAPEIAVLRSIHGNDSVRNIVIKSNENVDSAQERERLAGIYKDEFIAGLFGKFGELPETLEAARVESDLIVGDESKKAPGRKKSAEAAPAPEAEQAAGE